MNRRDDRWPQSEIAARASRDSAFARSRRPAPSAASGLASDEPARVVIGRWSALRASFAPADRALATASQVHGSTVLDAPTAGRDGSAPTTPTGMSSDRPRAPRSPSPSPTACRSSSRIQSGAIALLHSGWRGTAARIVERGIDALARAWLRRGGAARAPRPGDLRRLLRGERRRLRAAHRNESRSTDDRRSPRADRRPRARRVSETSRPARRARAATTTAFFSHRAGDAGPPARRYDRERGVADRQRRQAARDRHARSTTASRRSRLSAVVRDEIVGARPMDSNGSCVRRVLDPLRQLIRPAVGQLADDRSACRAGGRVADDHDAGPVPRIASTNLRRC